MVGGIFATGGAGGLPHFHFKHGARRGDGDETPAVLKGSTEITEGKQRGCTAKKEQIPRGGQEKDMLCFKSELEYSF